MSSPQAGWYPDPAGSPRMRWWNGHAWTASLRDLDAVAPRMDDRELREEQLPPSRREPSPAPSEVSPAASGNSHSAVGATTDTVPHPSETYPGSSVHTTPTVSTTPLPPRAPISRPAVIACVCIWIFAIFATLIAAALAFSWSLAPTRVADTLERVHLAEQQLEQAQSALDTLKKELEDAQ